jgi:hypothetical protein
MDLFGALTFLTAPIQSISIAPHNCQRQRRVLESDDAMHILLHRQAHVLEYSASFAWKRVHLFCLGFVVTVFPFASNYSGSLFAHYSLSQYAPFIGLQFSIVVCPCMLRLASRTW